MAMGESGGLAQGERIEEIQDKTRLLVLLQEALKTPNAATDDRVQSLHRRFAHILLSDKQAALAAFVKEGKAAHDFQFPVEETSKTFHALYARYEQRKLATEEEKMVEMEENLNHRCRLMRELQASIDDPRVYPKTHLLRKIEAQWRKYTPVPPSKRKSLQYAFFALTRQFYKKREMFMETERLDREKNFEEKSTLCTKLEELAEKEASTQLHKTFRGLCERYQRIGEVPEQEKTALRTRYGCIVKALEEKLVDCIRERERIMAQQIAKKRSLVDEMNTHAGFSSARIDHWIETTKKSLRCKERWMATKVALSTPETRELTKLFWGHFKRYIKRRNAFFKEVEAERSRNLAKKKQMIEAVVRLHDSHDWDVALREFKQIHREWKTTTLLPGREKQAINTAFKAAMDTLFVRATEAQQKDKKERLSAFKTQYAALLSLHPLPADKESAAQHIARVFAAEASGGADAVEKALAKELLYPILAACEQEIKNRKDPALWGEFTRKASHFFRTRGLDVPPFLRQEEAIIKKKVRALEGDLLLWRQNVQLLSPSPSSEKFRTAVGEKIRQAETELQKLKLSLGR